MIARARRVPPLVIVLAASCALSLFLALRLPLLDPDEGRNAEIAREMSVGGDLVIPHLAGMPYLDKPPGFFWAAALAIRVLGHTPLAARLPSLLASLALLLLVGRAAARAGGTRFGWISAALLAAAPLYAALSAYVIFDMMLALCVTVVWLGVAREVGDAGGAGERVALWRRLAMYGAIAAGILIKGPVMLAWALGGSLGAALILRSRTPLLWLLWIPGWFVALGLPGAWFWLASARFPEYPHYAFLEESLERLTSNSFHRDQGWWFVPAVLAGGALPWSLVTPWSPARWRRASADGRITARVGLGFVLFAALFFTFSHSQLVTYLLPALPPLAWCAAMMWSDGDLGRARRLALGAVLALTPLLAAAGIAMLRGMPSPSGAPLARAIAAAGGGRVRYEGCYSPGTDFLLGQISTIVSRDGRETTSNYQSRYRATLALRGMWKVLGRAPGHDDARFIVRFTETPPASPPDGGAEMHRDRVFTAYRIERESPADSTAHR